MASAGGHLAELAAARELLTGPARAITWVTWETEQSRDLLMGERCVFIDYVPPKSPAATARLLLTAARLVGSGAFDEVVSTGALPAVPFFLAARAHGIPCRYLESAARVEGPSLTGRILEWLPGVNRYAQHPGWAAERSRRGWRYEWSVFDPFVPGPLGVGHLERAVVMAGSSRFGFRRLMDAALAALPSGCQVTWQTGTSEVTSLPGRAFAMLPARELARAVAHADVVISHAGVGSALLALEAGRCPVLIPRLAARREHTDDHQQALSLELHRRGLAIHCDAESLTSELLAAAAGRSCARATVPETISPPRDTAFAGAARGRRAPA